MLNPTQASPKLFMRPQIKTSNAGVYAGRDKNTLIWRAVFKMVVYAFGNLFIKGQVFNLSMKQGQTLEIKKFPS